MALARGDAEFGVDMGDMAVHRVNAEVELLGDLLVCPALAEKPRHL